MKNKLVINIEYDGCVSDPIYKVEDAYNLYMRTRDKRVAERCYEDLKLEYQREKENASKV
jgi:ATP-dependent DNA ligase